MKIRSLELGNFRKFTGSIRVEGIGDGLNVLVGPNEYGKSTLLAAINGVIFERATSLNETVKGFRHFADRGVPEVALGFDLNGVGWTLKKRFAGQSGKTSLTGGNGHPLLGDAAEAELQRLLGFDRPSRNAEPGIWGTLWVQQGQSFGGANLDDAARRSLESCLAAQVGVVTGGQRGRKIPAAINAALDELKSTRGPRGKFKAAVDKLTEKKREVENLRIKKEQIFNEIDELARLRRDRQRALADWDDAAHQQKLKDLRKRHTAAATKSEQIEAARKAAELASERASQARKASDGRQKLIGEIASLEPQVRALVKTLEQDELQKDEVQRQISGIEQKLVALRECERSKNEEVRRLDRVRGALLMSDELRQHEQTLTKAALLPGEINRLLETVAANAATDENVSRIEDASGNLGAAREAARAVATTLTFVLEPSAASRVRLDGKPLDGAHVFETVTKRKIAIDGIGEITIEPKITGRDAIVEGVRCAEGELKAALERVGAEDLSAARRARAERHELVGRLADKQREISGLAPADPLRHLPAGLDARKARIAELQGRLKGELDRMGLVSLPDSTEVQAQIVAEYSESEAISRRIEEFEAALEGPKEALTEAGGIVRAREKELAGLRRALDDKRERLDAGRAHASDEDQSAQAAEHEQRADDARAALVALERDQGETVADIDVRIRRLEEVGREHYESINRSNLDIKRLETRIEDNEGAGVDEALDSARADEVRWQRAVNDYEEDVKVLELLRDTLRRAESEAKQLYLKPIAERTQPYLKMLLPGAQLRFGQDLGIEAIERSGGGEEFAYLSIGTQEQLAVLARLAFAELLLDKGQPATIILDDALVFSDDDRIERMFDVLTRAAEKVQIIVLTCRNRLFTRLGAPTLRIVERVEAG